MMRSLAPVRVRREDQRWRGWKAVCRVCGQSATTTPHAEALAWAHGHMHVRHPGWHDGPTVTLEQSIPDVWRTYVDPFWDREHP